MSRKTVLMTCTFALLSSGSAYAIDLSSFNDNMSSSFHVVNAAEKSNTAKEAHNFIKSLADRGIGFLSDKELSEEKRKQEFRKLLQDNFDMKTIARFSLGRYWKGCTDTQRAEYLKLFEEMIIDVYSRRFSDYNGHQLKVTDARLDDNADSIVSSAIVPKEGPEVKVDWRVREKSGRFQVVDIIVEGVSMSLTQRADFASVIQRGGGNVDTLLSHLRK